MSSRYAGNSIRAGPLARLDRVATTMIIYLVVDLDLALNELARGKMRDARAR